MRFHVSRLKGWLNISCMAHTRIDSLSYGRMDTLLGRAWDRSHRIGMGHNAVGQKCVLFMAIVMLVYTWETHTALIALRHKKLFILVLRPGLTLTLLLYSVQFQSKPIKAICRKRSSTRTTQLYKESVRVTWKSRSFMSFDNWMSKHRRKLLLYLFNWISKRWNCF